MYKTQLNTAYGIDPLYELVRNLNTDKEAHDRLHEEVLKRNWKRYVEDDLIEYLGIHDPSYSLPHGADETRNRKIESVKIGQKEFKGYSTDGVIVGMKVFKRIPNVRSVKIIGGDLDELFLRHGIEKKIPVQLEFKPLDKGDHVNRYIKHQVRRLGIMLNEGNIWNYWKIAWYLSTRSTSFFLQALWKSHPTWYKDRPLNMVMEYWTQYKRIYRQLEDWEKTPSSGPKIDMHRVYIKKLNGKYRPLGVPSDADRIALTLASQFLTMYLAPWLLPLEQHAYLPGKSVITAWESVLDKIDRYRNVVEFDLEGFFDNVKTRAILKTLRTHGIDNRWLNFLRSIMGSFPVLPEEEKLSEAAAKTKQAIAMIQSQFVSRYLGEEIGVPQGGNFSPLLAILCLKPMFDKGDTVMYADDGLIFTNNHKSLKRILEQTEDMEKMGIKINKEKSGIIKCNGKYLREDFKFLGLRYNPTTRKLISETRNGAELEFDKWDLVKAYNRLKKENKELYRKSYERKETWEEMFRSSIVGFILSRLYLGEWNPEIKSNFKFEYLKSSWAYKIGRKVECDLYNASSFAYDSLRVLLKKWDKKVQKKIIKGYLKGGTQGALKITKYMAPEGRHLRYKKNGVIQIPWNYYLLKKNLNTKLKAGEKLIREVEMELYLIDRRRKEFSKESLAIELRDF